MKKTKKNRLDYLSMIGVAGAFLILILMNICWAVIGSIPIWLLK